MKTDTFLKATSLKYIKKVANEMYVDRVAFAKIKFQVNGTVPYFCYLTVNENDLFSI